MKLIWPIRRSFVNYVRGNGGTVTLKGGTAESDEGFVFPGIPGDPHAFTGSVRFVAHGGMLDVRLGDPAFLLDGEAATLRVTTDEAGAGATIARVVGVEGSDLAGAELLLTVEGSRLLGDVYQPGSRLDGFRIESADA